MAATLTISDGTTTINLGDTTDFHMLDGWIPAIAEPTGDDSVPPYVVDVIPVAIQCANANALAAGLQKAHALDRLARQYHADPRQHKEVWFTRQLDGETGSTRSLVKSLTFRGNAALGGGWFDAAPSISAGRFGELIVEHHPYWERTTALTLKDESPAAGASVFYDYYNNTAVPGDVPARIANMEVYAHADSSGDDISRLWIGIRGSDKYAVTPTNFVNIWECENGTNEASGDTTDEGGTDATASGSDHVNVAPSSLPWTSWTKVLDITFDDVNGGGETGPDQNGEHLWLLRAKADADTTWQVQLRWGYQDISADTLVPGEIMQVDSTSWDYYEGGSASFPLYDCQAMLQASWSNLDLEYEVEIWAQRTSGTGDLYLDCLCPVPIGEGFIYVENAALQTDGTMPVLIATSPRDRISALSYYNPDPQAMPRVSPNHFYLPPSNGRMIIVYAKASSSVIGDRIRCCATASRAIFYPRWVTLRGAE